VVLCRVVAISGPGGGEGGEAPLKKVSPSLTKSDHLAFKIEIKKGKILKIKP